AAAAIAALAAITAGRVVAGRELDVPDAECGDLLAEVDEVLGGREGGHDGFRHIGRNSRQRRGGRGSVERRVCGGVGHGPDLVGVPLQGRTAVTARATGATGSHGTVATATATVAVFSLPIPQDGIRIPPVITVYPGLASNGLGEVVHAPAIGGFRA